MVGSYTNIFNGNPVKPGNISLLELSMSDNTVLSWPTEVSSSSVYFSSILDVASGPGLSLSMPDATLTSPGQSTLITNIGSNSLLVLTNGGVGIATVSPGQQWLIYLYDNTSTDGLWRAVQMGATTSNAQASALAGLGLTADGTKLDVTVQTHLFIANAFMAKANQATLFAFVGTTATTVTLDNTANLGTGWWAPITNLGIADLTIISNIGQSINNLPSIVLPPGSSTVVVAAPGNFNTFGSITLPISVESGGTGATSAIQALVNLGGTTIGIEIFTAPSVAAILALLGLNNTTLTESTVSTNQTLNAGSTQTAFVCTAALQLNLPLTTSVSNIYLFAVYAEGGAVTVHPNVADAINGGSAGANYVIAQGNSAMFLTDANGNWWPFFVATSGTVTSVGLALPGEFAVTGSPVMGAGTLTGAWVNQTANKVLAGPASGSAATPGFRVLQPVDIPVTEISTGAGVNPPVALAAYVATAALTITLPRANTLTKAFRFSVFAQNGAITLTPDPADAIQGGTAGSSVVIPKGYSAILVTDAAASGNWWLNQWSTPALRGYLGGLTLSNDGGTPASILDISAGQCTDSTGVANITLGTFTKTTANPWVAGSGNAGATVAKGTNQFLHVFAAIVAGVADIFFDTSITAANKPANTTAFRRIGSIRIDGSGNILAFTQIGDLFYWTAASQDFNATPPDTNGHLITLLVPSGTGLKVQAIFNAQGIAGSSANVLLSSPDQSDVAVTGSNANLGESGGLGTGNAGQYRIGTNASGQVRYRVDSASLTLTVNTVGWVDNRGVFD